MHEEKLQIALRLLKTGNVAEAAQIFDEVLELDSRKFDAIYLLGHFHLQTGDLHQGERLVSAALQINPNSLDALYTHGLALHRLGRHQDALEALGRLLAINPAVNEAWSFHGRVLLDVQRFDEALASLDRALGAGARDTITWNDRARTLAALGRPMEALSDYEQALLRAPRSEVFSNRANLLCELGRFEEAAWDFDSAIRLDPDAPYARGSGLFCKLRCCDWGSLQPERAAISEALASGRRVIQPGELIPVTASGLDQLRCARIWAEHEVPRPADPLWQHAPYAHDRNRVAYVSADFRAHAILQLLTGVFEEHDKKRFQLVAVSLGSNDGSTLRKRAEAAFEQFFEVGQKSDFEIARLLKDMEVDIAIDLMGFTAGSRSGIFALRSAPLQVSYLGFPATMGADFIDYIIADRTVIPMEQQHNYSEKVVYLPDSFQANDLRRTIADRAFRRSELGLPEGAFVFCSFNNHFKITPEMFNVWMRLLKQIEGSVLWLLQNTDAGARNLRREAAKRGIDGERLIFAPRMELDEHVARHRAADLFLDTLPCNSGTTASDALWAGLPVLTCLGTTFAGGVAASLLRAVGLQELVTHSLEGYAASALQLALDREMLSRLKRKLSENREVNPLFDTKRFTRHLEAAYTTMWERQERGDPPAPFAVTALPSPEPRR